MPAVKCKNCNGTGKIRLYYSVEYAKYNDIDGFQKGYNTCPNCGGSGCKWVDDENNCSNCGFKNHSEAINKLPSCNDCQSIKECEIKPQPGGWCRINCPKHKKSGGKQ